MAKITTALFDVGGVLIKYSDKFAFDNLAYKLDIDTETLQKATKENRRPLSMGEITEDEYWQRVLLQINRTFDITEIKKLYREEYKTYLLQNGLIDKTMLDFVHSLKDKGYKLAVIANTVPQNTDVYKDLGIYNDFTVLVLSYEQGIKKPEPNIFKKALQLTSSKPEECFFVDDRERHINAAKELGICGIVHTDAKLTIEKVRNFL